MTARTAIVTGAYGYLGSVIRRHLDAAGWTTVAWVRAPRPADRATPWRLGDEPPDDAWNGVDALVHCAYDFGPRTSSGIWEANVDGTVALLRSAARAGVQRCLVLSSMSAYPGTTQLYGRAKLAIEEATLAVGGIVVRPGLVYGDPPQGMAGTLVKLTRLPVVPVLAGRTRQFPVHQDDFAPAIIAILESESWVPEIIGIAQPTPMTFKEVLAALAGREGRRCRFVPVPWRSVYWSLRIAERVGIPMTLRSDSVLGLVRAADCVPASQAFPALPLKLRTLTSTASDA